MVDMNPEQRSSNVVEANTISTEWLAREVVATSSEAIVVTDSDGSILLWNAGATRIFGYEPEEALGQSLDLIIPEKLRARHWEGYRHTMDTGVTKYGDAMLSVPATHRSGQRLSIEFSVALVRDDAGTIVGISAIMREIGERREAERALRAELADLKTQVADLTKRVAPRPTISPQGYPAQPYAPTSFDA